MPNANPLDPTPQPHTQAGPERDHRTKWRGRVMLLVKIVFSIGMLAVIAYKVSGSKGFGDIGKFVSEIRWPWIAAAICMQVVSVGFSTARWQRLLFGQGILAPWRFLFGSVLIARFWGAFTPGGFTGFAGWRIYDIAHRTGKTARATATIGVEMVLGQLAFGVVVIVASIYGLRFVGWKGVLLVDMFFITVMVAGVAFLARPRVFIWLSRLLPSRIQDRIATLVDAVAAYDGKSGLIVQAAALGVGTHAFHTFIYVCVARALNVELSLGEVCFATSIQIFSTLVPISINGIGLREATAVQLYTSPAVGLPLAIAVLIPTLGFACEMAVSAVGGLLFMLRRRNYLPNIVVLDDDLDRVSVAATSYAPPSMRPTVRKTAIDALSGGVVGGAIVGLAEAAAVALGSSGTNASWQLWFYGPAAYGVFCGMLAMVGGVVWAITGRAIAQYAIASREMFANVASAAVGTFGLALAAFRVRRDVFHEELVWKSPKGILVLLGVLVASVIVAWVVRRLILRVVRSRTPITSRFWFAPLLLAFLVVGAVLTASDKNSSVSDAPATGTAPAARATSATSGAVIVIVVDTLRADHLPAYGYAQGRTPALDAFAREAVRFDQAFANASWTRPSFASILTGRVPSGHGVMSKASALSDEAFTLPEALRERGYATTGFVTNYNVAPYFNFHQGFDEYVYLQPNFVLGADDSSAKLLLVQFLRQAIEKSRARGGRVAPGDAYQDAEVVNAHVTEWVTHAPKSPWFLFVGYMDPHDPYFPHPYTGDGYARAAHVHPDPADVGRLRALYDGEITYWDANFGKLIEFLKSEGVYDSATIVVTSDHGEEFFDHGGFWHGTTLYDEQLHVPLFVRLPQARRGGTVVRHWVQSIDIMPTLLRELGAPVPSSMSRQNLFEGTNVVYAEESHEGNVLESVRTLNGTDEFKLITANPGNPRGLAPVELFRVDHDPAERTNVASSAAADVARTTQAIVEQRARAVTGSIAADAVEIDADVAERLKALGYIQGE